jgi:ABC-type transport system involved in cytochrome bd biosynthesis fused ATPase/permease subunit
VLEHGRIVADGSHDELLECSPLYQEIVAKGMPDQVFMTRNSLEVAGR